MEMLCLKIINASRTYIHQYQHLKKYLMVNYKDVYKHNLYLFTGILLVVQLIQPS